MKLGMCFLMAFFIVIATVTACAATERDVRSQFDAKYEAWLDAMNAWIAANPGKSSLRSPSPDEITAMGPVVLPFIVEKMQQGADGFQKSALPLMVRVITGKRLRWAKGEYCLDTEIARLIHWWQEERKQSRERFDTLYAQWKSQLAAGNAEAANNTYDDIKWMGIEILPFVAEKLRVGDDGLLPIARTLLRRGLAKGVVPDQVTTAQALELYDANAAKFRLPDPVPKADQTPPSAPEH